MATYPPYRVVCLLGRKAGLRVFGDLLAHRGIDVRALYTHSRKASFEDPDRPERPEFKDFRALAEKNGIPMGVVDFSRDAKSLPGFREIGEFDFLVCLSWRYLISDEVLSAPVLAPINLHRGKFPKYGGNFPVQRALEDGVRVATITAHVMQREIDTGEILFELDRSMSLSPDEFVLDAVERVKSDLEPYYSEVLLRSMNRVLERRGLPPLPLRGAFV